MRAATSFSSRRTHTTSPYHGRDGAMQEDGGEVFKYFVCCICPVRSAEPELGYSAQSGEFRLSTAGQTVANPALGFMFPCFDSRATNIYNALYYTRKPAEVHQELIDAVFRTPPVMSAPAQKDAFGAAISDALDTECSFDVVQSVHEHIRTRIAEHKEAKDPERLELTINEVGAMLRDSGLGDEAVESFCGECEKGVRRKRRARPQQHHRREEVQDRDAGDKNKRRPGEQLSHRNARYIRAQIHTHSRRQRRRGQRNKREYRLIPAKMQKSPRRST